MVLAHEGGKLRQSLREEPIPKYLREWLTGKVPRGGSELNWSHMRTLYKESPGEIIEGPMLVGLLKRFQELLWGVSLSSPHSLTDRKAGSRAATIQMVWLHAGASLTVNPLPCPRSIK